MEKIQGALSLASADGKAVAASSSDAQQRSIKTTTQDHPTVHTNIKREDEDALLTGSSTRQHPDVRQLVRMCKVSRLQNVCIHSL